MSPTAEGRIALSTELDDKKRCREYNGSSNSNTGN